jgi:hypothetical protein
MVESPTAEPRVVLAKQTLSVDLNENVAQPDV